MTTDKELVIFTQTYDLLTWLLPQCERFPKSQRFVVTQRLQAAALDFQQASSKRMPKAARSAWNTFESPTRT